MLIGEGVGKQMICPISEQLARHLNAWKVNGSPLVERILECREIAGCWQFLLCLRASNGLFGFWMVFNLTSFSIFEIPVVAACQKYIASRYPDQRYPSLCVPTSRLNGFAVLPAL